MRAREMPRQNPVFHNTVQHRGKGLCVNMQMRIFAFLYCQQTPAPEGARAFWIQEAQLTAHAPEAAAREKERVSEVGCVAGGPAPAGTDFPPERNVVSVAVDGSGQRLVWGRPVG